jgi:NADH-quinone oxidoreductase subunit E
MAQINKDYYEDLTPESLKRILKDLKAGRPVTPGPQDGRQASAPLGGPITLTDPELYRNEGSEDSEPATRPGAAANQRERSRAAPKRPLGKGRKPRPR